MRQAQLPNTRRRSGQLARHVLRCGGCTARWCLVDRGALESRGPQLRLASFSNAAIGSRSAPLNGLAKVLLIPPERGGMNGSGRNGCMPHPEVVARAVGVLQRRVLTANFLTVMESLLLLDCCVTASWLLGDELIKGSDVG